MRQRAKGRWIYGVLFLLIGVLLLPSRTLAAGSSLTLHNTQEGAAFQVYRVAERTEGGYALTGDFARYPVAIPGTGWRDAAATLAGYAARDKLPAAAETSISGGSATLSGLAEGLYLVLGEPTTSGRDTYTPVPFLVWLSGTAPVTAEVKYDHDHQSGGSHDTTCQVEVEKVWAGDAEQDRPAEITVQLLRNGAVYQSVTLSSANHWRHTWTGLSAGSRWQVTEAAVPEGYTVSVSQSGMAFTITNTRQQPSDPAQPTGPDDPTQPDDPKQPDNPAAPTTPTTPQTPSTPTTTTSSKPRLPQTGPLNWPVPVLAAAGLCLCAAGWWLQRRKGEDHAA